MQIIDRDISWLHFNSRLLQEAESNKNEITERIKFLGIYSNNLDEFYRVRIATLNRIITFNKRNYPAKVPNLEKLKNEIFQIIQNNQLIFNRVFKVLIKELENRNIFLINEKGIESEHGVFIKDYFYNKILPSLLVINIKGNSNIRNLNDGSIYLAVILRKVGVKNQFDYSIIEIPSVRFGRFIILPEIDGKKYIIRLDDIVRYCLSDIFSVFGYDEFEAYTFKFTRDSEIDLLTDVSKSFLDIVSESIKQRKSGSPVRFIYDKKMPSHLFDVLFEKLNIKKKGNCIEGARYHNSRDLMSFPELNIDKKHKKNELAKICHKHISNSSTIICAIKNKDILLYFPYHSFNYALTFLREASIDPAVRSIKLTLYRLANESKVISILINAANNGKYVTVFLELTARFDEEQNIYWTNKLREAGVKIIKTIPGIKVHSKLILVRRKENQKNLFYANISTGNFNEKTAELYCDFLLMTANQKIALEVGKVFYLLESAYQLVNFEHLIVSPLYTRRRFLELIEKEINFAKNGERAWIDIKLNSLSDPELVAKLVEAANSGVKIRINARAICTLVPVNNKNIKAIGIVDSYLEHARVFIFSNGGDNLYFIGSSDWMIRNLDNRIEVTTPIYDKDCQEQLREIMDIQFNDNVKARDWSSGVENSLNTNNLKRNIRSQKKIREYLQNIHQNSKI